MKNPFKKGDIKIYQTRVSSEKLAQFNSGIVHPVYSTFALGKDVEWACRLFVLEMLEKGEEGVGSYLSIQHLSPAPLDSEITIEAKLEEINGIEVICTYKAYTGKRLIAEGRQVQKIIDRQRFYSYLKKLQSE